MPSDEIVEGLKIISEQLQVLIIQSDPCATGFSEEFVDWADEVDKKSENYIRRNSYVPG